MGLVEVNAVCTKGVTPSFPHESNVLQSLRVICYVFISLQLQFPCTHHTAWNSAEHCAAHTHTYPASIVCLERVGDQPQAHVSHSKRRFLRHCSERRNLDRKRSTSYMLHTHHTRLFPGKTDSYHGRNGHIALLWYFRDVLCCSDTILPAMPNGTKNLSWILRIAHQSKAWVTLGQDWSISKAGQSFYIEFEEARKRSTCAAVITPLSTTRKSANITNIRCGIQTS